MSPTKKSGRETLPESPNDSALEERSLASPLTTTMRDAFGNYISLGPADDFIVNFEILHCHLSRAARFNGGTNPNALAYLVGQHAVLGALALLLQKASYHVVLAYFLHDHHEGIIGDLTTPTSKAIAIRMPPETQPDFLKALKQLKYDLDAKIYPAAGLEWPLAEPVRLSVKNMDARMLDYENVTFRISTDPAALLLYKQRCQDITAVLPVFDPPIWPEKATFEILQHTFSILTAETTPSAPALIEKIQNILTRHCEK